MQQHGQFSSTSPSLKLHWEIISPSSPSGPHSWQYNRGLFYPGPFADLGYVSFCPNVPVASEDSPTVTLNYIAEYLQPDGSRSAEGPVCSHCTEKERPPYLEKKVWTE